MSAPARAAGLPGVVQAPQLAEARVVGGRRSGEDVVGLRVEDGGILPGDAQGLVDAQAPPEGDQLAVDDAEPGEPLAAQAGQDGGPGGAHRLRPVLEDEPAGDVLRPLRQNRKRPGPQGERCQHRQAPPRPGRRGAAWPSVQ